MSLFPAVSHWKEEALTRKKNQTQTLLPERGRQRISRVNWHQSHKLCPHPSLHQPGACGRDLTRQCCYWVQSYLSEAFLSRAPVPGSQPATELPPLGEKNPAGELVYNENDWKVALHLITLLPWWSPPFCCSLGRRHLPVLLHMWYQLFFKKRQRW